MVEGSPPIHAWGQAVNADEFVAWLRGCAPDVDEIIRLGLPREAAERFSSKYRASPRDGRPRSENALIDLIARYHADAVEIGMVRFLPAPADLGAWWQVGEAEADLLVVDKGSGEVEVRDLSDIEFVIWTCAADAASFLDAIAEAACFISELALDRSQSQNHIVLFDAAVRCATLAGGEQYSNFYEMLLGCDVA